MHRFQTALALGTLYIVWGSTYIAIRIGVAEMPWALMAGTRFLLASAILLGALAMLRRPLRAGLRDLAVLGAAGVLLLGLGNGLLALGETIVPAGLAALIIATIPLWVAGLELLIPGGERLTTAGWAGLALGLVGLGVLLMPQLLREQGAAVNLLGAGALLLSAVAWSLGTLLLRRRPVKLSPLAATGYQSLAGGLFNLLLALLLGQHWPAQVSSAGWGSVAYLVVIGSLIGMTAFTWLTRHLAPAKLVTYAYVNPVVAVLLGVGLLGETLDGWMAAGMIIILAALVIVSRARLAAAAPKSGAAVAAPAAGD
ncbi:MAG: EamA family transporter [Anaerolineales bacterium]|nr:EamA family transporter [Anaerolineales bacterium]